MSICLPRGMFAHRTRSSSDNSSVAVREASPCHPGHVALARRILRAHPDRALALLRAGRGRVRQTHQASIASRVPVAVPSLTGARTPSHQAHLRRLRAVPDLARGGRELQARLGEARRGRTGGLREDPGGARRAPEAGCDHYRRKYRVSMQEPERA